MGSEISKILIVTNFFFFRVALFFCTLIWYPTILLLSSLILVFFFFFFFIFQASLIAQLVKNPLAMQETPVQLLGQEDPLEKGSLPTPVFLGFPGGSAGKESACNAGDLGSIPGLVRSPGEGKGYPLQ